MTMPIEIGTTQWGLHTEIPETTTVAIDIGVTQWGSHTEETEPGEVIIGTTLWPNSPAHVTNEIHIGETDWSIPKPITLREIAIEGSAAFYPRRNRRGRKIRDGISRGTIWGPFSVQLHEINIGETNWGLPEPPVPDTPAATQFYLTEIEIGAWPDIIPLFAKDKRDYATFGTVWNIPLQEIEIGQTRWHAPSVLERIHRGYYGDNTLR